MPFSATVQNLGVPSFGLINIDAEETAKAFQSYLETASKLTGVSLEDIDTSVNPMPDTTAPITLDLLLTSGMKLFDAIVWLTAGKPASKPLEEDPSKTKNMIPSNHEIARSVFYCYFMLLTQARYPASSKSKDKPKIPNFLTTIMGMDKDQNVYMDTICSFEPQKFDPAWVRHVKFANFGQEVLSRFGLGVAGYRSFGPFGLYKPKDGLSQEHKNAVAFAQSVAKSAATWNIHPLTRNPNILKARGNLNKNLGNLTLDVFSDADIDEMVAAKVLYEKPKRQPTHRNYLQWDAEDDISGSSYIF